jgi:2-polyprenyl-3-methyl-5-hydroxy-6-metoxy-1,4-benzoquinol methylase
VKVMLHKGTAVYQKNNLKIIECKICGFKHLDPIPSDEEIDDYYKRTYFDQIRQGAKGRNLKHYLDGGDEADSEMQWMNATMYRDVNEILSKYLPEGSRKICDIGCGSGYFLKYMSRMVWDCVGIEPSENAAYEFQNMRIINSTLDGFLSEYPNYQHFFDVVTLFGVLEHATNPQKMMNAVKKILKTDGIIFINVPNDFSPFQMAAQENLKMEPWWPGTPDHINYFSIESLQKFLESQGFSVIEKTTDFPMELFLLMGDNYIRDPQVGSLCHQKRKLFELAIPRSLRHSLYSCFAHHSLGRCCIVYARLKNSDTY